MDLSHNYSAELKSKVKKLLFINCDKMKILGTEECAIPKLKLKKPEKRDNNIHEKNISNKTFHNRLVTLQHFKNSI